MKFKDLPAWLGFRRSAKVYGHTIDDYDLAGEGRLRFANWNHPKAAKVDIRQAHVDELRRYLSPGDAVIDVGAFIGDTAMVFALAIGPTGRVFAVEPNRYALPILELNASLNPSAATIEVLPYAATKQPETLTFWYSDRGYCNGGDLEQITGHGHAYPLQVEGRNIADELRRSSPEWLDRVRFVKVDTEGNDHVVIEALRDLIVRNRPYLMVEVYKRSDRRQREALHRMIDSLGYDCYLADGLEVLKGEAITAGEMSKHKHFDMFCVPREA